MSSKFVTTKLIVSALIFFMVCLFGCVFDTQAETLVLSSMPGDTARLNLISIENETENLEFQLFYGADSAHGIIFPQSVYECQKSLSLSGRAALVLKCCKGSFLPVYIQDGGFASGTIEEGYEGPFYISMWLQFPQVAESSKVHVRYAVAKGKMGSIGIKIGLKGDYRLVAHEDVKFIVN
ncbi:MAG: hypothetical protein WC747_01240 [Candidatus Babeliales bacterium]|jgi:hypothetical protein